MADAPTDDAEASTSGRSVRVRRKRLESMSIFGGGGTENLAQPFSLLLHLLLLTPHKTQIAVEGCCHGDLDRIYETIAELDRTSIAEGKSTKKIELLVVCGDFQAVRNLDDLECLACPPKYRALRQFFKYYSGEKRAPVLTVFVGGNHEASNHLGGLPLGGWVAPNIFYLGNAGVFYFEGLRIAGLSGIFNPRHYRLGRHERPPYDVDSLRSAYHVREVDCWRLGSLGVGPLKESESENGNGNGGGSEGNSEEMKPPSSSSPPSSPSPSTNNQRIDLFVSHDWPSNVAVHGDAASLTRTKKHLAAEVSDGSLGSPPGEALLRTLRPRYWFSAHLHVKFAALVRHGKKEKGGGGKEGGGGGEGGGGANDDGGEGEREGEEEEGEEEGEEEETRFLALDKCVPGRQFLQVLDIPVVPAAAAPSSSSPAAAVAAAAAEEEAPGGNGGCGAQRLLRFDPHWLAVVAKSYGRSESRRRAPVELFPGAGRDFRVLPEAVRVSAGEVAAVAERLSAAFPSPPSSSSSGPALPVPLNFEVTAPAHGTPGAPQGPRGSMPRGGTERNPQTLALLSALGLPFVEDGAGPPDVAAAAAGGAANGEEGAFALPPPPRPPMAAFRSSAEEAVAAAAARVAAAGGAPPAAATAAAVPVGAAAAAAAAADPAEIDIDGEDGEDGEDGGGDLFEDPGAIHNMGQG